MLVEPLNILRANQYVISYCLHDIIGRRWDMCEHNPVDVELFVVCFQWVLLAVWILILTLVRWYYQLLFRSRSAPTAD